YYYVCRIYCLSTGRHSWSIKKGTGLLSRPWLGLSPTAWTPARPCQPPSSRSRSSLRRTLGRPRLGRTSSSRSTRVCAGAAIKRRDERARRRGSIRRAVASVVIACKPRRLDLLQRRSFGHGISHAVAYDRQHVAILRDIALVIDAALIR